MNFKSFSDVEAYLASRQPDIKLVNWFFALDDMKALLKQLGNPQEKVKIVHVAGTSGKTSTTYYIAKMLQLSGKQVGYTVSPHVDAVNERVQINSQPLSKQEFISLFAEFTNLAPVKNVQITYFGLLAAFAYWVFAKKKLDYAVVEVGMGGRTDATNVISNPDKICVITDIGLDHTQFLGTNLESIATQKAGIIHPGNHVFVARQSVEVTNVFKERCRQQEAILHILPDGAQDKSPKSLPLFQQRNWALAQFTYEYVAQRDALTALSPESIEASINMVVPARMERVDYAGKTIITDGSHNGQKLTALSESIVEKYPDKSVAAVVSFAEGKDSALTDGLQALHTITDHLIVTEFNGGQDVKRKAIQTDIIAKQARSLGFKNVTVAAEPTEAFRELLQQSEDVLLVTGSFFLLNHVRPILKELQ